MAHARSNHHRRIERHRARDRPGARAGRATGSRSRPRRPDKLEAAAKELADEGIDVLAAPANVADEEDIKRSSRPTASASAGWTCS